MEPEVVEGRFGWIHRASGGHEVVLRNLLGYDARCLHRSRRRLAERSGASDRPVPRFDYSGAGDSLSDREEPTRVETCIESNAAAARHLRERPDVERVSLCGPVAVARPRIAVEFERASEVVCSSHLDGALQ